MWDLIHAIVDIDAHIDIKESKTGKTSKLKLF